MGTKPQQDKCTQNDYIRLFADSADSLRWLSVTLTGNEKLSERVLSGALEQSLKGSDHVFREWMVSWARRLILKACVEIVRPGTSAVAQHPYPMFPMSGALDGDAVDAALSLPSDVLQLRLMRLDSLHRFVFVLRAMEGYSRRETSLLLNIDDRLCEWIYAKAAAEIETYAVSGELLCSASPVYQAREYLAQAGD